MLEYRATQYMNIYEWFAFLVNNKEITDKKILGYMKTTFKKNYRFILQKCPKIFDKNNELDGDDTYKELNFLYEKWKDEDKD